MVLAPLLALAACSSGPRLPDLAAGPSPADPAAGIRSISHTNPAGDYHAREPVEPAPWRRLNEQVAPGGGDAS